MRRGFLIIICLLCVITIAGILFNHRSVRQTVTAQESVAENPIDGKKTETVVDENLKREKIFAELIEKAQTSGTIRVIVQMTAAFAPEGDLSATRQRRQRQDIGQIQSDFLNRLKDSTVANVKNFKFIPFVALEADAETLELIKNSPEAFTISEDTILEPSLAESTVIVGAPGGVSDGFSGSGQAVAILDTGVDKNHNFLSGKIVSEACYSTTDAVQGSTSVCPGGASSSTAPDSGLHCPTPTTGCDHGTHVAGIAAGRYVPENRFGVAKDAGIIALQIFSSFDASRCGGVAPCARTYGSDVIRGLERVYELRNDFNIAAANMSLGGGSFAMNCDNEDGVAPVKAAIDNLRSVNIATVIAAGNNYSTTTMNFPGCISTAISIGSTRDAGTVDEVSEFSNSTNFLHLLAPGQHITSSIPGNNYATYPGTSMATPHVAGAWAILKQQNPGATVSQILTALATTGKIITDARAGAGNRQKPRIRLDAALRQLAGTDCVRTPITLGQTVNTSLNAGDCALEPAVNRDLYAFAGTANSRISIVMSSADFDAYLYLLDPNGKVIASNDNGAGGTNARIPESGGAILPIDGSYTIIATKSTLVFRTDAPQNGNYVLNILVPTAAAATVSGQVNLPDEIGLTNALMTLTDSQGNNRTILTGKGGRFRFNDVSVGETYILRVSAKRYTFTPQVVTVTGDITDLNFNAVQ